jgi:hypothetical protein
VLPPEAMFSSGMDFFFSLVAGALVLALVVAALMRVSEGKVSESTCLPLH